MVKVKNTPRKVPSTLPVARKAFRCSECTKEYGQKSNLARHMGVTHKLATNGERITEAMLTKYLAYNRGAKRSKRSTKTGPTTSEVERTKETSPDLPAAYPQQDQADPPITAKGAGKSTMRKAVKSVESDNATKRKPTKPATPICRRKQLAKVVSMPITTQALTKASSEGIRSKRRMEMAPSTLAKRVAGSGHLTSRRIAEDVASRYAMPSLDTRHNENIIRGMRAAERHLTAKIRRMLPLNRTANDINDFLTKLEDECCRTEEHDSDEFV